MRSPAGVGCAGVCVLLAGLPHVPVAGRASSLGMLTFSPATRACRRRSHAHRPHVLVRRACMICASVHPTRGRCCCTGFWTSWRGRTRRRGRKAGSVTRWCLCSPACWTSRRLLRLRPRRRPQDPRPGRRVAFHLVNSTTPDPVVSSGTTGLLLHAYDTTTPGRGCSGAPDRERMLAGRLYRWQWVSITRIPGGFLPIRVRV